MIENTPDGQLGRCETCGDRNSRFTGYGEAMAWCDEHERKGHLGGPRSRPSLHTLERWYRERGDNLVYNPTERALWRQLADELAEEIAARNPGPLEGQMALWESEPEGETG